MSQQYNGKCLFYNGYVTPRMTDGYNTVVKMTIKMSSQNQNQ